MADGGRLGKDAGAGGVETAKPKDLAAVLAAASPATVVVVDPLDLDELPRIDGIDYVLDFCGPGLLGMAGAIDDAWVRKRDQLVEMLRFCKGVIVSAGDKVPHYLGWAFQTGRDVVELPIERVEISPEAAEPAQSADRRDPRNAVQPLIEIIEADE